ncbi:hypothetical protein Pyrfu_0176 [Pyrolobus fumarii 1A]|uniref:Uncharacterized protein n=1 Tax=Pyrolobus fumarii (strain DSM 11204 / 1A) TaxID=694429 RepID=G0EET4_PYRF1|nr:hypothetical protein [Pyrolobus fumarii]AEM38048.1 hypothetical protein Pyrfu_0176 [Pyrolobus fumarii 1A]
MKREARILVVNTVDDMYCVAVVRGFKLIDWIECGALGHVMEAFRESSVKYETRLFVLCTRYSAVQRLLEKIGLSYVEVNGDELGLVCRFLGELAGLLRAIR